MCVQASRRQRADEGGHVRARRRRRSRSRARPCASSRHAARRRLRGAGAARRPAARSRAAACGSGPSSPCFAGTRPGSRPTRGAESDPARRTPRGRSGFRTTREIRARRCLASGPGIVFGVRSWCMRAIVRQMPAWPGSAWSITSTRPTPLRRSPYAIDDAALTAADDHDVVVDSGARANPVGRVAARPAQNAARLRFELFARARVLRVRCGAARSVRRPARARPARSSRRRSALPRRGRSAAGRCGSVLRDLAVRASQDRSRFFVRRTCGHSPRNR